MRGSGSPEVSCFSVAPLSNERHPTLSTSEPKDFRTSGLPDFRTLSFSTFIEGYLP
jgi:hypothetical protein